MKNSFLALVAIAVISLHAAADISVENPVAISNGMDQWAQSFSQEIKQLKNAGKYPATGYTECAESREVRSAFVCFYEGMSFMNKALSRASVFSEGTNGVPAGQIVSFKSDAYNFIADNALGHDIPSTALLKFYDLALKECEKSKNDPNICPSVFEKDIFENFVLPLAKDNKKFVLITTLLKGRASYVSIVSHEIMHAQYFLQDVYRNIVDAFWTEQVSVADKEGIKEALRFYDVSNDFVLHNEFQAYLLMANAESSHLWNYLSKYRKPLTLLLQQNGVAPVQVTGKPKFLAPFPKLLKLQMM